MTTNNATNNYAASPLTTAGDIYAYSSAGARLAVGSNYYFVQGDSTQSIGLSYQLPILQDQVAAATHIDFWGSNNGDGAIATSTSGTGSSCAQVNSIDNSHFGIMQMDMGTTTTGFAVILSNGAFKNTILGGSTITLETDVYFNALSNGTDTYTFYFGNSDASTVGGQSNGIYISYSSAVNSGHWTVNVNKATSVTTTNGSTGPSAQTWYKLRLIITSNTSVTGYVGAAGSDLTSIGTVTTSLPSVNLFNFWCQILKSAGTTDTFAYLDYISSKTVFTSLR